MNILKISWTQKTYTPIAYKMIAMVTLQLYSPIALSLLELLSPQLANTRRPSPLKINSRYDLSKTCLEAVFFLFIGGF